MSHCGLGSREDDYAQGFLVLQSWVWGGLHSWMGGLKHSSHQSLPLQKVPCSGMTLS